MRRTVAAAALGAGLFFVAACGDDDDGGGSTAEVCETVDAEGFPAAERIDQAQQDIRTAVAEGDQEAGLVAVADAQNAAADLVEVLRNGADDAEDEELSAALDTQADELEALSADLDPASIAAGEVPDDTAMLEAAERVDEICAAA